MSLIWWWVACTSGDPETVATREAVQSFRVGAEVLERDPAAALTAFQTARKHQPDAPLIRAWEGMALARSGDLPAAIAVMDELLDQDPRFAEARYNRAAWLARSGRLVEAGDELQLALRLGATRPREAMRDPDFTPHLEHPAFRFLPDEMLMVAVERPTDDAFWGSEVAVRFRVLGTGGEDVQIEADQASGPLTLVGVREDEHESSEGLARDLRYVFRVDGAGDVVLGPFIVRAGRWSTRVAAVSFATKAPSGKRSAGEALSFTTPVGLRGGWGCDAEPCRERPAAPALRVDERGVEVLMAAGSRIRGGGKEVRYDYSVGGLPLWTISRIPTPASGRVEVRGGRAGVVELSVP